MTQVSPPPPRSGPALQADGKFTQVWSGWFRAVFNTLRPGISVTVSLAKLTSVGTNGSLTVVNGIITGYVAPT